MLSKNQIKHLRSLRQKKHRHSHRQFLAEGETIVAEVLDAMPPELQMIVCTAAYRDMLSPEVTSRLGDRLISCDSRTLGNISALDAPSPVIALLDMPPDAVSIDAVTGFALYLDGIRDPGNLGAILRVADWFGVSLVYLAADCVDIYNPKTIQASVGSFLRVRTCRASLSTIRQSQPQLEIIGTRADGGDNALQHHWKETGLLVIGSESHGVRREYEAAVSHWLSIPRAKSTGESESLNAAVATGILCASYLARRLLS